jgi:putative hydrolases of HD superfamily
MDTMDHERLKRQLEFVVEIDRLKSVIRQTLLIDRSRQENSAEHSWHLAVMVILLSEYAKEKDLDVLRTIKMVLVHDLIEIDAGDTYCYDEKANLDKAEREQQAAERIFNLLPDDQAQELRALWEEFEARKTLEARFGAALDRLQPLLHNLNTEGLMWQKHGVRSTQVFSRNRLMEEGAPLLWDHVLTLLEKAMEDGLLSR